MNKIQTYKGKPLENYKKAELIGIIHELGDTLKRTQEMFDCYIDIQKKINEKKPLKKRMIDCLWGFPRRGPRHD